MPDVYRICEGYAADLAAGRYVEDIFPYTSRVVHAGLGETMAFWLFDPESLAPTRRVATALCRLRRRVVIVTRPGLMVGVTARPGDQFPDGDAIWWDDVAMLTPLEIDAFARPYGGRHSLANHAESMIPGVGAEYHGGLFEHLGWSEIRMVDPAFAPEAATVQ